MKDDGLLTLAVDTGSPLCSVAIGAGNGLTVELQFASGRSGPPLLERIHALLAIAERELRDVDALIGAGGPGGFTGLRGGLATLLGLQQVLNVRATAVSTFLPLNLQAPSSGRAVAAIDALRGEWFVQPFGATGRRPLEPPRIVPARAIRRWAPCRVIAFGVERLRLDLEREADVVLQEAKPLARDLLRLAASEDLEWDSAALSSPQYLRPPAAAVTTSPPQRGL